MNTLSTQHTIRIGAQASKVWEALTTPSIIKQWFLGVDTIADWNVNGPIVHTGEWQGKRYEDKGTIIHFEPPKLLTHTHWSIGSGLPDEPENYQEVSWELSEVDHATTLKLTERNLPSEEGKAISAKVWAMVLENLKKVVEQA